MRITYKEYIQSVHWEERKRLYFASHARKCAVCGHPDVDLHHLVYANYGSERDKDLAPLCRFHHEELHSLMPLRKSMFYHSSALIDELKQKWDEMFR